MCAADPSGVIDFNADMGESFGAYRMGLDEEVIQHVTSVSVAAGFGGTERQCPLVSRQYVG